MIEHIDISDFKNFEMLDYEQKLKLCIQKYQFDTLVISISNTDVNSYHGFKLSDIPFITTIHTLYPKSKEEEIIFIRFFEENSYFVTLNYSSNIVIDEFDFLKEYWIGRIEIANLKEELYNEELSKMRSIILLENREMYKPSFQVFFELGVNHYKIGGGVKPFYFWQMYFREWEQDKVFISIHTLTTVLRLYYQGYIYGQYYHYLKNFNFKDFNSSNNISTVIESINSKETNNFTGYETHSNRDNSLHKNITDSLNHRAIAMLYYYLDVHITDNNAQKYAHKHGQKSGIKLMEHIRTIKSSRFEILNHRYSKKYFEAIEPIIRKTASKVQIERMEKDYKEVKKQRGEKFSTS